MIVWLDETGSDRRNSIRAHGYGLRGLTLVTHKLKVWGKRGYQLKGNITELLSGRIQLMNSATDRGNMDNCAGNITKLPLNPI